VSEQIQSIVSLLAAIALIVQATFLVESARSWGQRHRLGDVPAGVLLGVISVAQMFHPLEPIDGVIIDLRLIPLFLAAAFLSRPATLIALAMAGAMRIGIGGTGMASGVLSIGCAGIIGTFWAWLQPRLKMTRPISLILLGQMAAFSLASAAVLPGDIRAWFFAVAAPPLALAYMTLVPILAYILVARVGFEHSNDRTRREALSASGVNILSRAAFFRHLRVASVDDPAHSPIGFMSITPSVAGGDLSRRAKQDVIETAVRRLRRALPRFEYTTVTQNDAILVPVYEDQFPQISQIAVIASDAVAGQSMKIPSVGAIKVGTRIGLVQCTDFDDVNLHTVGRIMVPRRGQPAPDARPAPADLLFAKAGLLFSRWMAAHTRVAHPLGVGQASSMLPALSRPSRPASSS